MATLLARRPDAPPATVPHGRRVYAVGDVHGRLDLLDALLGHVEADNARRVPAHVTLILLGDLIDRGPESAGVVERAMAPLGWAETRVLMGNHEAAMLAALSGDPRMLELWLANGGIQAMASWGCDAGDLDRRETGAIVAELRARVPAHQLEWLAARPLSLRIGDYLFVHAGIRPGVPLAAQAADDMLWIRDEFLMSGRDHGMTVVHGHTITPAVVERPNRIGIDTGAYMTDRLTALGLEGGERWLIRT